MASKVLSRRDVDALRSTLQHLLTKRFYVIPFKPSFEKIQNMLLTEEDQIHIEYLWENFRNSMVTHSVAYMSLPEVSEDARIFIRSQDSNCQFILRHGYTSGSRGIYPFPNPDPEVMAWITDWREKFVKITKQNVFITDQLNFAFNQLNTTAQLKAFWPELPNYIKEDWFRAKWYDVGNSRGRMPTKIEKMHHQVVRAANPILAECVLMKDFPDERKNYTLGFTSAT